MEELKFAGLRSEMAKYGHTNKFLAELLDLSESAISRRFSGEIEWTLLEVAKICEFYKKDWCELGFMPI